MGHEWQEITVQVRMSKHNSDEDRSDEVFYNRLHGSIASLTQSMCAAAGKPIQHVAFWPPVSLEEPQEPTP